MIAELALLLATPVAATHGAERNEAPVTLDFSAVRSVAAAKRLVADGRLVAVLLFPAELGGEAVAANTGYVTPEAAAARQRLIAKLKRMVRVDSLDHMTVEPVYSGKSVVPSRILFKASYSRKAGEYDAAIDVW